MKLASSGSVLVKRLRSSQALKRRPRPVYMCIRAQRRKIGLAAAPRTAIVAPMLTIRPSATADDDALWSMLRPVFRAGDTYAVEPDIDRAGAG